MSRDGDSVAAYMRDNFADFKLLLQGSSVNEDVEQVPFWDCVVLTAYDCSQRRCLEQQLEIFRTNGRLPKNADVRVIADPDDWKLGCGGSTLHCLRELRRTLGDSWLRSSKVLIIHSGGSSQRLPSYSAQGKIFAPMPVADLAVDGEVPLMLDVKLALYLPLCRLLPTGVLMAGSDHIETYVLPPQFPSPADAAQLESSDVLALAHPSDLATGEGHGVYVLHPQEPSGASVRVESVLEVLQKPSRALMRERGAVIEKASPSGGDPEEMVYSDSVFWLSHRLYDSLLSWYDDHAPLQEEFDAYAHLLPAFGERVQSNSANGTRCASNGNGKDQLQEAKNPSFPVQEDENNVSFEKKIKTRPFLSQMKEIMKNRSLKVIVLECSKFHHLGSMREYVDNLTNTETLKDGIGLQNITRCNVENFWVDDNQPSTIRDSVIVMGSYFGSSGKLKLESACRAVIEWSDIDVTLLLNDNILISNCIIRNDPSVTFEQPAIRLFKNICMHTVPIREKDSVMYVTSVLNIDDDIKASSYELHNLFYFGISMNAVLKSLGYKAHEVTGEEKKLSLWNLRIFPRAQSRSVSFWMSYAMVNRLLNVAEECPLYVSTPVNHDRLYSLSDMAALKDLDTLLKDRRQLESNIKSSS